MRWSERAGFAPSSLHLAQSLKTRRRQGAATWRRSKQHDHLRGRRPLLLRYGSKTVQLLNFLMKQTRSIAKTGSGQTTQRDVKTEACFCNIDRTAVGGGFLPTLANKAEEDHMVGVVKSECSSSSSDDVGADGSGPTVIPLGLMVKKRAF